MNLNKSLEFFDPEKVKNRRHHIIGCGSIGSNVAELLARFGIENLVLYDFDIVESHNIANQIYTEEDVSFPKTEQLAKILYKINPKLKSTLKIRGKYENQTLTDYVFMCVDSVEVRQQIVKNNMMNPMIKGIFDFRTTLYEGQCYYADWSKMREKESLLESLNFTHEEALANTPVSACGFELSVAPVVRMTAEWGIVNFTNLINGVKPKRLILVNPYSYFYDAM